MLRLTFLILSILLIDGSILVKGSSVQAQKKVRFAEESNQQLDSGFHKSYEELKVSYRNLYTNLELSIEQNIEQALKNSKTAMELMQKIEKIRKLELTLDHLAYNDELKKKIVVLQRTELNLNIKNFKGKIPNRILNTRITSKIRFKEITKYIHGEAVRNKPSFTFTDALKAEADDWEHVIEKNQELHNKINAELIAYRGNTYNKIEINAWDRFKGIRRVEKVPGVKEQIYQQSKKIVRKNYTWHQKNWISSLNIGCIFNFEKKDICLKKK